MKKIFVLSFLFCSLTSLNSLFAKDLNSSCKLVGDRSNGLVVSVENLPVSVQSKICQQVSSQISSQYGRMPNNSALTVVLAHLGSSTEYYKISATVNVLNENPYTFLSLDGDLTITGSSVLVNLHAQAL